MDQSFSSLEKFTVFKSRFKEMMKDTSVEVRCFLFGLLLGSHHYTDDFPSLFSEKQTLVPIDEETRRNFDFNYIRMTQLGGYNDDSDENPLYYLEGGKLEEVRYIAEVALKAHLPDFCIFYTIGLARGFVNSGSIEAKVYSKFLHGTSMSEFISRHSRKISSLYNFFDEIGSKVTFDKDGPVS